MYPLPMLSILIPTFNEEQAIETTIRHVHAAFAAMADPDPFEIVVIDDGSTDRTPAILKGIALPELQIIAHPRNRGYGASMKTGIRRSRGSLIATIDADGTYPIEKFPQLLQELRLRGADMVVGARVKKGVRIPWTRRPAKAILGFLARVLTGLSIPDLNSGMRIFTRELGERYMHLYPQRFSFTITITLAALTNDYVVEFLPIDYYRRIGPSTMSSGLNGIWNFLNFLSLIVRIITYFHPIKFFAWPSGSLLLIGAITIGYTLWNDANISDVGLLTFFTGLQIGVFGLLAETVVRHRRV
ncbi:hypothetical protein A3H22_02740 [Candidatus Peribacteria bacterium RIFCSPLOWO2_12_FULL_55_15]|nr:MAG: hypothetical protein A2789_04125 [Candidatus Peribacteria bacterium RIFCSPHIGHO2_01_FULL_54_22]OGJ63263.1 MAG: hypothetical protein A3D12_02950 [Candidatus Peribacteria bacterium RIFCSPHIGHO2_02_FULL_55_24]OGJ63785.1 MAG: hypothetical protein A3E47_00070 [Candidatus Peribacteria bacterium RIFCSPHIGHO2_12_FULL_54_10]OGJ70121.1 MAG: hypothetical protein A3H90_03345 [Candidatus Peribacteria bacterium RIFCSPLOWO2_02_FULL_55_36]OGJ70574.1 MAG: hypothetical protein A3H22_02740 [Candidatus Per